MKKSLFSEEQIAFALQQAAHGTPVAEVIRKVGVSEQTFYRWKKKYSGLGPSELRRLRQLEEENRRLKQMVADLSLDKHLLQEVLRKNNLAPGLRRELVLWLQTDFDASVRHDCEVLHVHRSAVRYQSQAKDQAPLTGRIKEIAAVRVRYGYKRIHVLLRREGWGVNHKRVYRLYCQEGLNLRRKRPRRHVSSANRQVRPEVTRANECWAMDFVSDALFDGRRLRVLTVLDVFTRESMALEVGQNLRGDEVAGVLELLLLNRQAPKRICCDNGQEFVSKTVDKWADEYGVELAFSIP